MDNLYDLAAFISELKWDELPQSVKQAAARCVLDTVSAAAGASGDELLKEIEQTLTRFDGGGVASLWGRNRRGSLHTAVMLNAMAAHTLELDDVHTASKTHIGSVAIPAAWALGEALGASGAELLLALVCAYETTARIGMALGVSAHRNRGWHATGTAGTFGAAAACAKLFGLDKYKTVSALGMAGTQSSGLWSFLLDGATCKPLHAGRAAVSGLDAALMAYSGMKGTGHVLEAADGGLLAAMSGEADISCVNRGLGEVWEIQRLDNKPYPCCRSTHCAIDAALALRPKCLGRLDDIASITVDTYLVGHKQCGMSAGCLSPASVAQAKFSTPYAVAAALTDGEASFSQFTPERLADKNVRALMAKVEVRTDEGFTAAYPKHWGCKLTVKMKNGELVAASVPDASGSLTRPLSEEQLAAKATGLLRTPYGENAPAMARELLKTALAKQLPKLLLQDKNLNYYPILIEYKGYKDKLIKLDSNGQIENKTAKNEPNFKNINNYAVNGAVHYANAILHHTSYTDIISIGMTGFKNEQGKIEHQIGVYYVSKSNFGIGQKIDDYTDFSFLKKENFDKFIEKVENLHLTDEEIEKLKEQREKEINDSLKKLNQDIYDNEKGLGENDRVYLVAASIIATLGIPGKVTPLEKSDLKSSIEQGNTDGDIIVRKIKAFLNEKALPSAKKELIIRTLQNTLTTDNINKVENGESQLKRVFTKIVDDLGIYYKIGLTTDFTGKLFNEMYGWLGFSQDKLNDVVLTPSYVANLLVKLARVNKDSYVWDFATGSAGLLVAAMNEMLIDAKNTIKSPEELAKKSVKIKAEQLLGLELLSSVYMLAILNMILMGDGSSNILNKDSLKDFNGTYGFGKTDENFPADAFVLNPPYSQAGNGMVFVEKALSMMNKGYAAIIIQNSAGSGKATSYNKKILEHSTLLASIKMPVDIFIGKSSVQTNVYVFRVGEAHQKDEIVKFIDFSNDGYTRTNRKKASNNLKDTDRAKERYQEIVELVRFGKSKLNIFTEQEYYEGHIDPLNGADWNQTAPIDTKPTLDDFKKTVSDYLAWEVSNILKGQNMEDDRLGK